MEWHHTTTTWSSPSEFEKAAAGLESVSSASHLLEWQLPTVSDPVEELCDQAQALKNFCARRFEAQGIGLRCQRTSAQFSPCLHSRARPGIARDRPRGEPRTLTHLRRRRSSLCRIRSLHRPPNEEARLMSDELPT